jgi:geranylgeranyl diphosphate synthase type II
MAREHATEEERKELDYWYSKKTDNVDKVYGVEKIFRRTKVDEKALRLIEKHNEIGKAIFRKSIFRKKRKNRLQNC